MAELMLGPAHAVLDGGNLLLEGGNCPAALLVNGLGERRSSSAMRRSSSFSCG